MCDPSPVSETGKETNKIGTIVYFPLKRVRKRQQTCFVAIINNIVSTNHLIPEQTNNKQ